MTGGVVGHKVKLSIGIICPTNGQHVKVIGFAGSRVHGFKASGLDLGGWDLLFESLQPKFLS